ncbi:polysaccharide pyruvyl transferase family protein [Vibrio sp. 1CM2L]|uniref:polysaccharide pyruvyl transferase family protein n=1 Tax=Vibrio sp. 1CM2L TaxID=2929166 RepID=UPI0020C1419C|nr:polysaccharide pyruvyl transferase family protein [Vibrio sp. 1CM2L]MCK8078711.1 polysaccharide pyruvyl transferase family protein [Vibrio sp. 1CM2L]
MRKHKVGILNFQYSTHNYGAVLQAAALEHVIKDDLNISAEHIDYRSLPLNETSQLRQLVVKFLRHLGVRNPKKRPDIENEAVFERFRKDFINRSPQSITEKNRFIERCSEYSHVVVGSDQVWRTNYTKQNADVFFLPFKGPQKVSYAASFGVDLWEESKYFQNADFIKWINDFDNVSVRESAGVDICKKHLSFKGAVHVLDPTLLAGRAFFESILDYYMMFSPEGESQSSKVAYYKLDVDRSFSDAASHLASKLNTDAENFYYKYNDHGYEYFSVPEWLNKIKISKVILTDSYHCICLAILFNKEFVCVSNASRGVSRLESLLGELGLESRLVSSPSQISEALITPIDYTSVERKLDELRVDSKKFLKVALNAQS